MFGIKPGLVTAVIDGDSNIKYPFEYYKIVNIAETPDTHYKSNTVMTPIMLLLLSILEENLSESRVENFARTIACDAKQIEKSHDRLMDISKNEDTLKSIIEDGLMKKVEAPIFSAVSDIDSDPTKVLSSFKAYAKLESKRIYTNEVLPVLKTYQGSIGENKMVTLLVDSQKIADILKIDAPSDSEKVIMKISSIDVSHAHYQKQKHLYFDKKREQISFEKFLNLVYHRNYLNELAINLYLDDYNQKCSNEEKIIRKPEIIGFGEIISANYRGFYILERYLSFFENKPKTESNIMDGLDQLKIIHSLGIDHGDVARKNICVDADDKIWLLDFGHSWIINDWNRDDLECSDKSLMKRILND